MPLYLIHTGMTLSILCFYGGYSLRLSNNKWHRILNSTGIFFNLISAAYLLFGKYISGGIDSLGIEPIVPSWGVHVHRFFAAISLLLMLAMGFTGYTRKRELHKKLHYTFLTMYTIIYISGLLIFKNIA